jgi:hypothetical protein
VEHFLRRTLEHAVVRRPHARLDGIDQCGGVAVSGQELPRDGRALDAVGVYSRCISRVVEPGGEKRDPRLAVVEVATLCDLPGRPWPAPANDREP